MPLPQNGCMLTPQGHVWTDPTGPLHPPHGVKLDIIRSQVIPPAIDLADLNLSPGPSYMYQFLYLGIPHLFLHSPILKFMYTYIPPNDLHFERILIPTYPHTIVPKIPTHQNTQIREASSETLPRNH